VLSRSASMIIHNCLLCKQNLMRGIGKSNDSVRWMTDCGDINGLSHNKNNNVFMMKYETVKQIQNPKDLALIQLGLIPHCSNQQHPTRLFLILTFLFLFILVMNRMQTSAVPTDMQDTTRPRCTSDESTCCMKKVS